MFRLIAIALVVCVATPVRAEEPIVARMPERDADPAMRTYFAGERNGGFVLGGMGVAGLVAGGVLYADGGDYARGMSYSLLGVGVAHVAAGAFVNLSSAKRVRVFGTSIQREPEAWVVRERKRMRGVSLQFLTLKIVETALIAGGTAVAVAYKDDRPTLAGVGAGIAIEMAATLVFDIVAARRAHRYRRALDRIAVGTLVEPDTTGVAIGVVF